MIKKEMEEEDTCEIVQKLLINPQTDQAQYQLFRETHNLMCTLYLVKSYRNISQIYFSS